jgi:hypothetical protein
MMPTEGPQACPVCRATLWADPSRPIAQQRCPRCGAELWALGLPSGPIFFLRRPDQSLAEFLVTTAGPRLGASTEEIDSFFLDADSLDTVEFLVEWAAALERSDADSTP